MVCAECVHRLGQIQVWTRRKAQKPADYALWTGCISKRGRGSKMAQQDFTDGMLARCWLLERMIKKMVPVVKVESRACAVSSPRACQSQSQRGILGVDTKHTQFSYPA